MRAFIPSPTVQAENFVRRSPAGLTLDELLQLKKQASVIAAQLLVLANGKGFMSANERANISHWSEALDFFIAEINDIIQSTELVAMLQAAQAEDKGEGDPLKTAHIPRLKARR